MRPQWTPLAVLLACAVTCAWLIPTLGGMAVPVVFYMLAITTMVAAAILTRLPWAAAGPVPFRDILVWTTYYLGQLAIALVYLMDKPGESSG